jgi:hypothetical protein
VYLTGILLVLVGGFGRSMALLITARVLIGIGTPPPPGRHSSPPCYAWPGTRDQVTKSCTGQSMLPLSQAPGNPGLADSSGGDSSGGTSGQPPSCALVRGGIATAVSDLHIHTEAGVHVISTG